jgi:hypothetical protein
VWLVGYLGDWRRAAEVLFVGEGLPWHFEASAGEGQEVAGGVADRAGTASGDVVGALCARDFKGVGSQYVDEGKCVVHPTETAGTLCAADSKGNNGQNAYDDKFIVHCMSSGQANAEIMQDQSPTLSCNHEQPIITCASKQQSQNIGHDVAMPIMANDYKEPQVVCYENHANDSRVTDSGNLSPTITSRCGTGGGNLPLVKVTAFAQNQRDEVRDLHDCAGALAAEPGMKQQTYISTAPIAISDVVHGDKSCNGKGWNAEGAAYTLDTMATQGVCYGFRPNNSAQARSLGEAEELCPTLPSEEGGNKACVGTANLVRRLTVKECERLMGFQDGWTDIKPNGKPTPDSPRYKACGNSWAVNCARWVMMRIQQSEDKYT